MVNTSMYPTILNGTDFSAFFKYKKTSETLRKISGPNAGRVTLGGKEWVDLIDVKYDLTATILPMGPEKLAQLCAILAQPTFQHTYFSGMRNQIVTRAVICPQAAVITEFYKMAGTIPVYANMPVVFREQ